MSQQKGRRQYAKDNPVFHPPMMRMGHHMKLSSLISDFSVMRRAEGKWAGMMMMMVWTWTTAMSCAAPLI